MNINATLLIQMLVFIAFVAITMRYIWPPITRVLEARRKEIADGLAAADQGQKTLSLAHEEAARILARARIQGAEILESANQQSLRIIEEAKMETQEEHARMVKRASQEINQHTHAARAVLMGQISELAIAGASKILESEVDPVRNGKLIQSMLEALPL